MPHALPISIIALYSIFTTFVFYQQLYLMRFRGSSKLFEFVLSLFVWGGMITGLVFLVYYGWKVVWWAPIILLVISLLFQFIANFIERALGTLTLSLLGFAGWPACAYFMFKLVPTGV